MHFTQIPTTTKRRQGAGNERTQRQNLHHGNNECK